MNMEAWKDEIMNSLDGIEKVQPSDNVFHEIQETIRKNTFNRRQWLAVAATVSLVLFANLYFILTYSTNENIEGGEPYSAIVNNYNIY